jgi:hypothetical protein
MCCLIGLIVVAILVRSKASVLSDRDEVSKRPPDGIVLERVIVLFGRATSIGRVMNVRPRTYVPARLL